MSQAIADEIMAKLRNDANLIASMAGVYPGDSTGDISADAYILNEIADLIDDYDWEMTRQAYLQSLPEIEVTYENPSTE